MPSFETLLYSVEDGIATITLNRPDKLNAFNTTMMQELIAAFDETDADDNVKAVIITGAGRAFCAGADLSAGAQTFDYDARGGQDQAARQEQGVHRDGGGLVTLRIYDSLKPVISACNGAAVGIGVTMQLAMDFRLASSDARYGFVFARRGINPEAASSWFLPRLVGIQTALEWCYTGRIFPAQEGLDKGLVRSVHAPEDLLPAARALAREIVDNTAPVSVAVTRQPTSGRTGRRPSSNRSAIPEMDPAAPLAGAVSFWAGPLAMWLKSNVKVEPASNSPLGLNRCLRYTRLLFSEQACSFCCISRL